MHYSVNLLGTRGLNRKQYVGKLCSHSTQGYVNGLHNSRRTHDRFRRQTLTRILNTTWHYHTSQRPEQLHNRHLKEELRWIGYSARTWHVSGPIVFGLNPTNTVGNMLLLTSEKRRRTLVYALCKSKNSTPNLIDNRNIRKVGVCVSFPPKVSRSN
jgi:hypothetical protein